MGKATAQASLDTAHGSTEDIADGKAWREHTTLLQPVPLSARTARRFVRGVLIEAGRMRWSEAAELAVTEIVTNAILHAHTELQVSARLSAAGLRVEVRDSSLALPVPRSYDSQASTGRGMELVAAVTSAYGVRSDGAGKVVWFSISDDEAGTAGEGQQTGAGPVSTVGRDRIVLLGFPSLLGMASQQHHDALLRELALHLIEHPEAAGGQLIDFAAADQARALVSEGAAEAMLHVEGPLPRPAPHVHPDPVPYDVVLAVPTGQAGGFVALQQALDLAESLALRGDLLVRPGAPEVISLRDWACDQVAAQLAGAAPSAWCGAADERFTLPRPVPPHAGRTGWEDTALRSADRPQLAVDDTGRVVAMSQPLTSLLGWRLDDLIDRRFVTVIPPGLREACVAGFSRYLDSANGDGRPLPLPLLHRDGRVLPGQVSIARVPAGNGRTTFVATIGLRSVAPA